jgi:glyceraldehyde 3-phosphate dehydrogenase
MKKIRVGINGFGRIGRLVYRILHDNPQVEVAAINDLGDPKTLAHLLKYDSAHGIFDVPIVLDEAKSTFTVGQDKYAVRLFQEKAPVNIFWDEYEVEVVIESTGHLTNARLATQHLLAPGVKKVIISAPAKNVGFTTVLGVNFDTYDREKHHVISNASCTTNCLAPVAKVLNDAFGIKRGFMNTIHAYTNDQNILDAPHKDLRRARAAAVSVIPTTTGAAQSVGLVLPELKGKLDGFATRVPTIDGSMIDLTLELKTPATKEQINQAMHEASVGEMSGIIEYTEDPIVSVDIIGNKASAIFDSGLTMVIGEEGTFVKVVAWYDNEFGYAHRLCDLITRVL